MSSIKRFPGFEHVYSFDKPLGDGYFYADFETPAGKDSLKLLRAEWLPTEPLQAYWTLGASKPKELAYSTSYAFVYLHRKVMELLVQAGLTGWSTYPLTLHSKAGDVCDGYVGFSVTGRCGPIAEERGELLVPDPQFPEYRGIYFDESTWDGSDFFCPSDHTAYVFATEAVKRLFKEKGLKELRFTRLTDATRYRSSKKEREEPTIPPEETEEHTVVYQSENTYGVKAHVCRSFAEALETANKLQSQGTEVHILKGHEVVWSSIPPGFRDGN